MWSGSSNKKDKKCTRTGWGWKTTRRRENILKTFKKVGGYNNFMSLAKRLNKYELKLALKYIYIKKCKFKCIQLDGEMVCVRAFYFLKKIWVLDLKSCLISINIECSPCFLFFSHTWLIYTFVCWSNLPLTKTKYIKTGKMSSLR